MTFVWVCLNGWKRSNQKHNEWVGRDGSMFFWDCCCFMLVFCWMSIKDHVCVAQGLAPGLMHCPCFVNDKSLWDISAPEALIYWKYYWFLHCDILYATCLSSIVGYTVYLFCFCTSLSCLRYHPLYWESFF